MDYYFVEEESLSQRTVRYMIRATPETQEMISSYKRKDDRFQGFPRKDVNKEALGQDVVHQQLLGLSSGLTCHYHKLIACQPRMRRRERQAVTKDLTFKHL